MQWPFKSIKKQEESARALPDPKSQKNFFAKAMGIILDHGAKRSEFNAPEYDFEEIRNASEADSYVKMAFMKYSYMMFKAGYEIKSDNEEAREYIKTRFKIMSYATKKPIDLLWQEIGDDLIKYSNAFLIKSRVDTVMPGVNAKGVYSKKPIGGYYRVDPDSVKIKRGQNGEIIKYRQGYEDEKDFNPEDVIHFYLDKTANNAFGTPRVIAALEDVKLLRRIEGHILSLIYRFAIPIYQWIIGLPQPGYQATETEIKEMKNGIEKMALDGVIVTNEKTAIKAIGAEGNALDASRYLAYFEKRVFTALGVSESQMGRGGSKQDADSMEAQAHDTIKYIQRVMSIMIENYIINELLLEGGFNPILNEKDIVTYQFNEISLETKIKVENHEILKYQSNITTFDEVRQSLGKKPDVDKNKLYYQFVELDSALEQIEAKEKSDASLGGNGLQKSAAPDGAVKNNNLPTNQHGTTSVNIKEALSEKKKKEHKEKYEFYYNKYNDLKKELILGQADKTQLFEKTKEDILTELNNELSYKIGQANKEASKEILRLGISSSVNPSVVISNKELLEECSKTIIDLFKDIDKQIKDSEDSSLIESVFNVLEYRFRFLLEYVIPKSFWYGYTKTGAYYNLDKAYIDFGNSEDKEKYKAVINPLNFKLEEIPAFHSYCSCKVSFDKKVGEKNDRD